MYASPASPPRSSSVACPSTGARERRSRCPRGRCGPSTTHLRRDYHPGHTGGRTPPGPDSYARAVEEALALIDAGALRKVVLARTLLAEGREPFDAGTLVSRLRPGAPDRYVFAMPLEEGPPPGAAAPDTRILMGASPELLVSRFGRTVHSNPLAGSIPRGASGEEDEEAAARRLMASRKDREEHALVVESVVAALEPFCDVLDVPREPRVVATPSVLHLSTPLRGVLREPAPSASKLAAAMHPTPAVCGTPAPLARKAIRDLEPVERGYYSGLVGWEDADGNGEWAISLRCAELQGNRLRLYAGAGIVAGSEPVSEVAETQAKFQTLLGALTLG